MQTLRFSTDYKVIKKLATGGMGSIYLAEQTGAHGFSKTVAVKTIRSSLISDKETLDLFIGEAKLVADLIHENIVQVYQFEEIEGVYYLVMEYADGQNLENFLSRYKFLKKSVPIDIAAYIISRICRGLDYAHRKRDRNGNRLKIVHRDVSPSNIILTFGGGVKLTDFGIAKALTMKVPDEHHVIMGKLPYLSPEQVHFEGTDPRSDIFSLGLVSYELLTGKVVFNVDNDLQLLNEMKKPIVPVRQINPSIPSSLNDIVMKALSMEPEDRFRSAKEMGNILDAFLHEHRFSVTAEKLSRHLELLFPEAKRKRY